MKQNRWLVLSVMVGWLLSGIAFAQVSAPATQPTKAAKAAKATKAAKAVTQPSAAATQPAEPASWPPPLRNSQNGTATITSEGFLRVPPEVQTALAEKPGAAPFIVAKTPPTVDVAFHAPLPNAALNGTGWTEWGDICLASDGKVYSGIGDHGKDAAGGSYCFIFQWDPQTKTLKRIADMREVAQRKRGDEPSWSKVHARIDEGADGKIYFSCTLNDGQKARDTANFKWSESLPGGQIYQFDPQTGKTTVFASLPPARCTATALIDRQRNIWWCNLESGPVEAPNALYGFDLTTKKVVYQSPDGAVGGTNRNFALAKDGSIYFNGKEIDPAARPATEPAAADATGKKAAKARQAAPKDTQIWKYDPKTNSIGPTKSVFRGSQGMRSSTTETKDGWIYGTVGLAEGEGRGGRLFRYSPPQDKLEVMGPEFLTGDYTTVMVLSPDERFLYYLPGAHGGAVKIGTPVVQYEIATGQRKVIAFLRDVLAKETDWVPAGTYGVKLTPDGSTLYVNFNGHAADSIRPVQMKDNGFGFTAFAAIHIPSSER